MLTVPVSVLALIPMFLVMFRDFATLPLSLKALLFAIYLLVLGGIVYVALIGVAVWIFGTDRLLTGRLRRGG